MARDHCLLLFEQGAESKQGKKQFEWNSCLFTWRLLLKSQIDKDLWRLMQYPLHDFFFLYFFRMKSINVWMKLRSPSTWACLAWAFNPQTITITMYKYPLNWSNPNKKPIVTHQHLLPPQMLWTLPKLVYIEEKNTQILYPWSQELLEKPAFVSTN